MTELISSLLHEAERTVEKLRSLRVDRGDPPPPEFAEALEDAANLFLDLSAEISAANIQP